MTRLTFKRKTGPDITVLEGDIKEIRPHSKLTSTLVVKDYHPPTYFFRYIIVDGPYDELLEYFKELEKLEGRSLTFIKE